MSAIPPGSGLRNSRSSRLDPEAIGVGGFPVVAKLRSGLAGGVLPEFFAVFPFTGRRVEFPDEILVVR